MKKVLILQIKNHVNGGIRFVNKVISDELVKLDYEVRICSIRAIPNEVVTETNEKVRMDVINEKDEWEIVHKRDVWNTFKEKGFCEGVKKLNKWLHDYRLLKRDYSKMRKYVNDYNPDYIIVSHYQALPGIPKKYLKRTINEHHTSYQMLEEFKDNKNKLLSLRNKIKFVWLTESSCNKAKKDGFENSYYIYNPIKFETDKIADVVNNKKIVTIARLGKEKRIDLMIDLVDQVFKEEKYNDWTFEIYGFGDEEKEIKKKIKDNKQIKFMGITNNSQNVFMTSSINLNTSKFEGFSLCILEAYECGIPTIAFNFGESCHEEIIDDVTGFIVEQGDLETYKNKIKELIEDSNKLKKMSIKSKDYAKQFNAKNIVKEWIKIFEDIDRND